MGIDYVVAQSCAAKEGLGVQRIVDLVKARSRAEAVMQMYRSRGDARPAKELTFVVAVNRAGKMEQQRVSVQTLLDQAAPLEAHRGGCASCPANQDRKTGYGCYDSISYPIEADTERWLLDSLPEDLAAPAGLLFKRALADFAWDGAHAAAMRAQGETFFRLRETPVRRWKSGESVTGDQLFHMMFHVGHLQPAHAKMLCLFFGLIELGDERRARRVSIETSNARGMIDFLNTVGLAQSRGLAVLIDA